MVFWVILSVAFVQQLTVDPAPGILGTKSQTRNYECDRMTTAAADKRRPGLFAPARPRGDFIDRSVVVCTERMMRPGLRSARDEAILSNLDSEVGDFALAAKALRPELLQKTWLVETYYPSAQVSPKIAFATKNALMGQGLSVSDRSPALGASDVAVITRLPPELAYSAACQRYFATGSLGENDVMLGVVHRDPRETALHAGLCAGGTWTWLR